MDDVVFRVASTAYTWEDVLDWGRRQEAWGDHVREVREGVAALTLARRQGDALDGDVSAAAAAFRRQHRLISAEDTERWLAQRRLTVSTWKDHIRRSVARDRHPAGPGARRIEPDPVEDEPARLWATGMCSGFYSTLAEAVAERAAAADARAEAGAAGSGGDRWEVFDAALAAFRQAAATERAVADELVARRLDWIDLDVEWVTFPAEAAAREALLCLREDGDFSAAFVPAQPAAVAPVRRRAHLCDFEPELRPALFGAKAGDALGPARMAEGWRVTRVVSRTVPTEGDEEVHRLAAAAVGARAVRREVEHRVRWHGRY